LQERDQLILFLKGKGIQSMFHYPGLHTSPFYLKTNAGATSLMNAEKFSDCLLRLPLFVELSLDKIEYITTMIFEFYK
jgi:dTDP-4-amino-4,6-dideoxygalactose transaminase